MPVPTAFLAEQAYQQWLTVLCGQMSLAEVRARDDARQQALQHSVTGRNQMWLVDFAHFYIGCHGSEIWRITGVADYWSRYEFCWHVAPAWEPDSTARALASAIREVEELDGRTLSELLRKDPETGKPITVKVIAQSMLGFCDRKLARYVAWIPGMDLIRTWSDQTEAGAAGQRGFEALQAEVICDGVAPDTEVLIKLATRFREHYNARQHPALAGHSPLDVYLGYAPGRASAGFERATGFVG